MSVRDEVLAAFEKGDELAVRRLGWWPDWEAAATWWAPRQTCTAREFIPYAKLLGGHDPALVLEAFKALAGDWRPHPASVLGWLNRREADRMRVDLGRGRDRASLPSATAAVALRLAEGEQGCSCLTRSPTWLIDGDGVLRCPGCEGIEWGQVFAAEDAAASESPRRGEEKSA